MSNQHNRVKKFYTPLPLLHVHTKPAKRYQSSLPIIYKLLANKSNEQSNHLSNLENLNKYLNNNDLSDSEQYSNKSNKLDQYSSETYQYSSESDKDVDWEISEEKYFLDSVDWENNEMEYLHDNYNQDKAIKFAHVHSVVKVNERQFLGADPLVSYHGLPGHLHSNNRKTRRIDFNRLAEYKYFVTEILYSFNGWWHIRDLIKRHRAPYEYIPIPTLPP
ncbi:13681_t:CDS:2, partial [Dentiscutata erythropus]